jgi:asparagine synthase (glutamine-hydrolysing)
MSGTVGIFRRDGGPVERRSVQDMLDNIRHRGPDRSDSWISEAVGFGHAMLWTTPESLEEALPWFDNASGLCITADARIDNRQDLIASLGLGGSDANISDSRLILYAYEKWGESCPEKLVGDFVFAIWDIRKRQVFCARDPMGIKCLYYYASGDLFAFASEIKALCSLPEVPVKLNEVRVLDYLTNIFDDRSITFYKDIYRLPAASTLTVTPQALRVTKYWNLDPSKELKLSSDEQYAEAFRECFLECVRSRMRSAYPIGVALSGGLDSSSIACAARSLGGASGAAVPLQTFSLIFPTLPDRALRQIDERGYMDEVLKLGGFQPNFVRADECSPLRNVKQVQKHLDEAYFEGNLYLHWAMYETANRQGARIFLDGLDGDTTVSHGLEYLTELTRSGKWPTLITEARLLAKETKKSSRHILRDYSIKPFLPIWTYNAYRRLRGRPADVGTIPTFVKAEFAEKLKLKDRNKALIRKNRKRFTTARAKHLEGLMYPLYAHALEVADKASAAFGIEARYPFFDRRLIELCLSLPPGQKLSQGWCRSILRRGMAGILPEKIRWRQSKGNLSSNFYLRLLDQDRELVETVLLRDSGELAPYVDLESIRTAYRKYKGNPLGSHTEALLVFAAVNLGIWLRTSEVRP